MTLRLSAPSKTFLIGEYAVLLGGQALVLNTEPRFELVARKLQQSNPAEIPFHKNSPAAKWWQQRAPLLNDWSVEFLDPHLGRGGFGASSAQFVLIHALTTFLQSSVSRAVSGYDLQALRSDFQVLTAGQGSGADVLAQTVGQVAQIKMAEVSAEASPWPFQAMGFSIVRTAKKVATHEHLEELHLPTLEPLLELAAAAIVQFQSGREVEFVKSVQDYNQTLVQLGLQLPETRDLIERISKESWCLAAKGCGALGADTLLLLHPKAAGQDVAEFTRSIGLEPVVATESRLSPGLEMKWSWNED